MQPDPVKTKLERSDEFDVSAQKAINRGDLVFARELAGYAEELRTEYQREHENDQLKKD